MHRLFFDAGVASKLNHFIRNTAGTERLTSLFLNKESVVIRVLEVAKRYSAGKLNIFLSFA